VGIPAGLGTAFFEWLKETTEQRWADRASYQFPRYTRWRPGLDPVRMKAFEAELGYELPPELRSMLWVMNGTCSPPEEQVLRSRKVTSRMSHLYGYPHDALVMHTKVVAACTGYGVSIEQLGTSDIPRIHPIVGHRYLVVDRESRPVLSIYGRDAIVCGASLRTYLLHELLGEADVEAPLFARASFWLDESEYPPVRERESIPGIRTRRRASSHG
jgi:hypothetical protein